MKMEYVTYIILGICVVVLFGLAFRFAHDGCHWKKMLDEDKYCREIQTGERDIFTGEQMTKTITGSYEQDALSERLAKEQQAKMREEIEKEQECYSAGHTEEYTFDIMKNYNYSCKQLAYINDHLIDNVQVKDGGYISGSFSGFLSYGSIESALKQYVVTRILATGQLVQNMSYHLDCNGQRSKGKVCEIVNENQFQCASYEQEQIDYYDEAEFVMYYVENCIE